MSPDSAQFLVLVQCSYKGNRDWVVLWTWPANISPNIDGGVGGGVGKVFEGGWGRGVGCLVKLAIQKGCIDDSGVT